VRGAVGKPIRQGFRTACQSDTDFRAVCSSIYEADPASIRTIRKTSVFRHRCRRADLRHAHEFCGFLRVDRRTVLVPSPYAYQKASWLVLANLYTVQPGKAMTVKEMRPAPAMGRAFFVMSFAADRSVRKVQSTPLPEPKTEGNYFASCNIFTVPS
jgi:hypothetical protein